MPPEGLGAAAPLSVHAVGGAASKSSANAVVDVGKRVESMGFEHLQTQTEAETTLRMLVALFPEAGAGGTQPTSSSFRWVRPEEVPAHPSGSLLTYRDSLVHEEHLTKVLQDQLGGLDVDVERSLLHGGGAEMEDARMYSRRIFLTAPDGAPHALGGQRVGHAILHTDLDRLPAAVREGVRAEKIPFGRLLMDHVRERCVLLRACWRVELSPTLLADFLKPRAAGAPIERGVAGWRGEDCSIRGHDGVALDGMTYGRTVTIVCDGQIAAEVLEIMAPGPAITRSQ